MAYETLVILPYYLKYVQQKPNNIAQSGITLHLKFSVTSGTRCLFLKLFHLICLTEKLTTTDLQSKKKNRIDPIVITVIVCVIVAVLIIVVVVYWRKKKGNHCSRTREFTIIEEWPVFSFGGS